MRIPIRFPAMAVATLLLVGVGMTSAAAAPVAASSSRADAPAAATEAAIPVGEFSPGAGPMASLNRYVTFSAKGYRLNAPASVLKKIPTKSLAEIKEHFADTNLLIATGQLVMHADGEAQLVAAPTSQAFQTMATKKGKHGYAKSHWYGWEFGLDPFLVSKFSNGAGTVGGFAGLAIAIGATGAAAPIIAAVGALLWAEIPFCAHSNGWAYIYVVTLSPVPAVGCNPF